MSNRSNGDMPSFLHSGARPEDAEGNGISKMPAADLSIAEQPIYVDDLGVGPPAVTHNGRAGVAPQTASISAAASDATQPAPHIHAEPQRPAYAALDLGTNNCRLLVATPTKPGRFRVIDSFSRIVRLGEGLDASGRLSDNAMRRAIDALSICAAKLKTRQLRRVRLIATEACRSAENGSEFLERVRARTGLSLEIINRGTEAKLAVAGCAPLVADNAPGAVLFDIGGGSTEIILCDLSQRRGPRLDKTIIAWTSLPVGVVSLAERFGGRDVTPDIYDAMVAHVVSLIEKFEGREKLGEIANHPDFHLLGTSGTVTTLAGLLLGLERYDRRQVDGLWVTGTDLDRATKTLRGWNYDERVANACIGPDRADLVLAGCAVLDAIRAFWPSERLRVADRGLREGVLLTLMGQDGAWRHNFHAHNQHGHRRSNHNRSA
jgi:exopolyphosphatase / guanosine-5'-triphosphate,3'-diphosphate pyrophosphatase